MKLILQSNRILTAQGKIAGTIEIYDGKISSINAGKSHSLAVDLGDLVLMPGLVDPHVHINEPGRTAWEGFATASRAAAAGGSTTLVDMPLNSTPVTTTVEALKRKQQAAEGKLRVNCGYWAGLVPGNFKEIEPLIEKGVLGFKAFLIHSGIDDFPSIGEAELREAMQVIAKHELPVLAHCELFEAGTFQDALEQAPSSYQAYLQSRPKAWEDEAIRMMIRLCRETGCRTHIVHLSSANCLAEIVAAKEEGLPLTVETCPHYLYFNAENIPDAQVAYKCAPPIREKENNDKLWAAIQAGHIDFIATDHSPAPISVKEPIPGNLMKAWGGIASLQWLLPTFWTRARKRGFGLEDLPALLSSNAARFIGMKDRKGQIAVGYDADLVVWDPDARFVVEKKDILHRHKVTPYLGEELYGLVKQTYVGGKLVF